ncbi:MAG: hypothetical protein KF744_03960 [Taibaiella sp.]|nr:hypothetical protein [Taibaiella sp.]
MIRKFNYTNRKKIPHEFIDISLSIVAGATHFNASINFPENSFPENAKVYIEPYYGPSYLRFDFGTVKNTIQPSATDIGELKRISDKVYFRIKVVDESVENGLLLGFADKIPTVDDGDPDGRTSILYVNAVEMDTNEVWRVNFSTDPDGMPILEVNRSIDGIRELAKNDAYFFALVYPSAIRQILRKVIDDGDFDDSSDTWSAKWVKFCRTTLGVTSLPRSKDNEEECEAWADSAVRAFCKRYKTLEGYKKQL